MCRGDGPYRYGGDCDPVPPQRWRSGSPANCEREGRQADDPRTDQWREQREEGGAMTRFGTKRIGALALAVAGVTAIAACSSSSSSGSATASSTSGAVTQPGSVGSIPAAGTPSGTAGSISYGLTPGSVPNWILPIPTAAFNTVYNTFQFGWQMWRPIYFAPQGTTPTVDAQLSVANTPVWSNDDKTMSITLKPWKWSNGQTVSSKDLE